MTTELETVLHFLRYIGIETNFCTLDASRCFLPGLLIEGGRILIDLEKLLYAGDLLHEAGHVAVVPEAERVTLDGPTIGSRKDAAAEEMMAIAWSYAACVHLTIAPSFVFHEAGYRGGGAEIARNFKEGNYFGVPLLQWLGMTGRTEDDARYPAMVKWLRG